MWSHGSPQHPRTKKFLNINCFWVTPVVMKWSKYPLALRGLRLETLYLDFGLTISSHMLHPNCDHQQWALVGHCSHHLPTRQLISDTRIQIHGHSVHTKKSFFTLHRSSSVQTVLRSLYSCVNLNHLFILRGSDWQPGCCRPDGSSIWCGCFVFIIEINTHSSW